MPLPPSFSDAGVHDANVETPFALSGGDVTFAHDAVAFTAADAGTASGAISAAPAATATMTVAARNECFIS